MSKLNFSLEQLLEGIKEYKGSDLHLNIGVPPSLRKDGKIMKLDLPNLTNENIIDLCYSVLTEKNKVELEENLELDFSYEIPGIARFRANYYYEKGSLAAVFRIIPNDIPTLEDLNSPKVFYELAEKEKGLILVTGPTGSGKSTTLAAIINHINKKYQKHILTIEDPIEFVHKPKNSIISQREIKKDTKTFKNALRAALREDPDIILVGEMRDKETVEIALTAAETGHLVLGTLHTNSSVQTISRIINIFTAEEQPQIRTQLSLTLEGIISQSLIPKINGGRTAAHEIMINTPAISNLVRENKLEQMYNIIQTSSQNGMITLNKSLKELVEKNIIDFKDAIISSYKPDELKKELGKF